MNDHFSTALRHQDSLYILESWSHLGSSWELVRAGQAWVPYWGSHSQPHYIKVPWDSLGLSLADAERMALALQEPSVEAERTLAAAAAAAAAAQAAAVALLVAGGAEGGGEVPSSAPPMPPHPLSGAADGAGGEGVGAGAAPAPSPASLRLVSSCSRSSGGGGSSSSSSSSRSSGGEGERQPPTPRACTRGLGSDDGSDGGLSPSLFTRLDGLADSSTAARLRRLVAGGLSGQALRAIMAQMEGGASASASGAPSVEGIIAQLESALPILRACSRAGGGGVGEGAGAGAGAVDATCRPPLVVEEEAVAADTDAAQVEQAISRARSVVSALTSPRA